MSDTSASYTITYQAPNGIGAAACAPNYGFMAIPMDQKCSTCGGHLSFFHPTTCGAGIQIGPGSWRCDWCDDPRTKAIQARLQSERP